MKVLLDTHVWIWSQEQPEKLGRRAAAVLVSSEHTNCVCTVSTLEIARLRWADYISLSMPLQDWIQQSLADLAAETIPVTYESAVEAYALPGEFHQDPADRLLVATARCFGLSLMTADDRILEYRGVRTIDARR